MANVTAAPNASATPTPSRPPGSIRAHDEEAPDRGEARGAPKAAWQGPAMDQLQPHEQQQRTEVLDRDRDADLETRDRGVIEGAHPGEPDDPHDRKLTEVPAIDLEQPRTSDRERREEHSERAHGAELRQARGRHVVVQQEVCDRPVQRPERGGRRGERVAEPGGAGVDRHSGGVSQWVGVRARCEGQRLQAAIDRVQQYWGLDSAPRLGA